MQILKQLNQVTRMEYLEITFNKKEQTKPKGKEVRVE
jgi:hypothetical protein